MVFSENDVCNLLMQGRTPESLNGMLVDSTVDLERIVEFVQDFPNHFTYYRHVDDQLLPDWDQEQQHNWHMPDEYKQLDIAEYLLGLCASQEQLQRVGEELLLYQERNMFDLLRYLKYLVDTMRKNNVIWGVGRGSSTASYVLYLLGVHRIDSMFYELDVKEFLR